jgi:hypothetical protein
LIHSRIDAGFNRHFRGRAGNPEPLRTNEFIPAAPRNRPRDADYSRHFHGRSGNPEATVDRKHRFVSIGALQGPRGEMQR